MENWSTLPSCQRALRFFGLWPTETLAPLYLCRTVAILGLHAYYVIYFAVMPFWQGTDKMLYSYSYIIIASTALHRVVMIPVKKKQIMRLCSDMERNYTSMEPDNLGSSVSRKTRDSIKTFCTWYMWRQTVVMAFWCMGYVMSILYDLCVKGTPYSEIKKELPYGVHYSFDWEASPAFELLFVFEMLQITTIIYTISISDCTLFTIVAHISGQLQALIAKIQLEEMEERKTDSASCVQTTTGSSRENIKKIRTKIDVECTTNNSSRKQENCRHKDEQFLHHIITHHNEIYRFADSFEQMCSTMLYIKFFATTFFLCLTAYMVSISLDSPGSICRFMSWALYESNILYNYCRLGEQLTGWSLRVNDALFYLSWQDKSVAFKETCWIMMVRAQRPIILKAGPFYTLSFPSFRKILESSYSYLMVLLQMNKKLYRV
ncbi:odorant receptor 4-like [Bacillus rossius redtenbacheri]|uniref:odorant receptor 4-like n=1 Tax=Bacillus rossius redtenbacheri TaxID=93214 RepID=UPI002FDE2327